MFVCLVIGVLAMVSPSAGGPWCYKCDEGFHPAVCGRVIQCQDDEECYTQRLRENTGGHLFYSGCRSKQLCSRRRRFIVDSYIRDKECLECCSHDGCNAQLCGAPAIHSDSQIVCHSCLFARTPDECDKVEICNNTKLCYFVKGQTFLDMNDHHYYRLGCSTKQDCSIIDGIHVNQDVTSSKKVCCTGDLCAGRLPDCGSVPPLKNASVSLVGSPASSAVFTCNNDTSNAGQQITITCQANATWSTPNSTCTTPSIANTGSTLATAPATKTTIPPPSAAPSAYDCNFEKNLCSWTQSKDDQFDWTRLHGGTTSSNTGPSVDHTLGTNAGYYVYIETSNPRVANDKARLQSALISSTAAQCLHFYYHMYGPHVNRLNVYLKTGSQLGAPIFTKKGTLGNKWIRADVDISGKSSYSIVFEGVRGTSFDGDIGLDDISVTPGTCGSVLYVVSTWLETVLFIPPIVCFYIV